MTTVATTPATLDDLPDGTVIRSPFFVAEAVTTDGRRQWGTTTGKTLDSAAVAELGPALIISHPHTGTPTPAHDSRELAEVVAASAELTARSAQCRRASERLATKVARAHEAGLPYQAIADVLGVSRQRVAAIAARRTPNEGETRKAS